MERNCSQYYCFVSIWNKRLVDEPERQINLGRLLSSAREALSGNLSKLADKGFQVGTGIVGALASGVRGVIQVISILVLIPIYTFFLLRGMNGIRERFCEHLPGRYRERMLSVLGKIHIAASGFFQGRLIVCGCVVALTAIGLMVCGVRFSVLIGLVVGIGSLIPFVGVIIGLVPACALAYFDHGWLNLVGVVLVFIIVQGLEGFLLTPLIIGRKAELHPLAIIISVFVGGELLGLFGILLAVPLACAVKILGQEFVLPQLKALAKEEPEKSAIGNDE